MATLTPGTQKFISGSVGNCDASRVRTKRDTIAARVGAHLWQAKAVIDRHKLAHRSSESTSARATTSPGEEEIALVPVGVEEENIERPDLLPTTTPRVRLRQPCSGDAELSCCRPAGRACTQGHNTHLVDLVNSNARGAEVGHVERLGHEPLQHRGCERIRAARAWHGGNARAHWVCKRVVEPRLEGPALAVVGHDLGVGYISSAAK